MQRTIDISPHGVSHYFRHEAGHLETSTASLLCRKLIAKLTQCHTWHLVLVVGVKLTKEQTNGHYVLLSTRLAKNSASPWLSRHLIPLSRIEPLHRGGRA